MASQHGFSRRVALLACATSVTTFAVSPSAGASGTTAGAADGAVTHVRVSPTQVWTRTGVSLRAGEQATIYASGRIHFGAHPIDQLSPAGIPRGPRCAAADARQKQRTDMWPVPTADCWSLIARVGAQPPFEVGSAHDIRARSAGELYLGVNDNYLRDNAGAWSVDVTGVPARTGADVQPASPNRGRASTSKLPLVAAAFAAVGLLAAVVLSSRRRHRSRTQRAAVMTDAREMPFDASVAGGKIHDVGFADDQSLRVDYAHFPDGTVVHWQVAEDGRTQRGQFVAAGGGRVRREETIVLEPTPTGRPCRAEVSFAWSVGAVSFNYAVHLDRTDASFSGLSGTS